MVDLPRAIFPNPWNARGLVAGSDNVAKVRDFFCFLPVWSGVGLH